MKLTPQSKTLPVLAVLTLAVSGCENLNSTEAGLLSAGLAGAATGIVLGTTGIPAATAIPVSLGAAAAAGTVGVLATNMSTSRDQRAFAESRGQAVVADARRRGKTVPSMILVDTISKSPSSGRAVMMYNTATGKVTSNKVYYTSEPPNKMGYNEVSPGMNRW